jgi:hypothetical protein
MARWLILPLAWLLSLLLEGSGDAGSGAGDKGAGDGGAGSGNADDGGSGDGDKGKDEGDKGAGSGDLGDAGKRALDEERRARTKAERDAKAARDELARIQQANEGENEKKIREAGETARKEEREAWASRVVAAEVRARAGTKLADPEDAVRLLDLAEFEVGDDGEVDREKIDKAVDKLLGTKPYLAAEKPKGKVAGSADGGARKGEGKPDVKPGLERLRSVERDNTQKR